MQATNRSILTASALVRPGLVALAALLVSGCYEHHLERRETISAHGGDAVAGNIIMMTNDPWPDGAWNKTLHHDGHRMSNAITVYRTPPDAGSGSTDVTDALSGLVNDSGSQTTE